MRQLISRVTTCRGVPLLVALSVLIAAPALAGGDLDGNGVVDAADVSCLVATLTDHRAGCAATPLPPPKVITVAPAGADYTSVSDAASATIGAGPDNPYLIKVAPGSYPGRVNVQSYTVVEGSGVGVTVLENDQQDGNPIDTAVVVDLRPMSALRNVTVDSGNATGQDRWGVQVFDTGVAGSALVESVHVTSIGLGADATGIFAFGDLVARDVSIGIGGSDTCNGVRVSLDARADLEDLRLDLSSVTGAAYGVRIADGATVNLAGSDISLIPGSSGQCVLAGTNSDVTVDRCRLSTFNGFGLQTGGSTAVKSSRIVVENGIGLRSSSGSLAVSGTTLLVGDLLTSGRGIWNSGGTGDIDIRRSRIAAGDFSIIDSTGRDITVVSSQVDGPISVGGGTTLSCASVIDQDLNAVACP
jgi:hypothetical protein